MNWETAISGEQGVLTTAGNGFFREEERRRIRLDIIWFFILLDYIIKKT